MNRHYLDHASSCPLRPEAAAAVAEWCDRAVRSSADPGRVHHEAQVVRAAVEDARQQVAGLTGVRPRQVVFTSGGTEAVHAAVWGATRQRPGAEVLCAAVEHSSVRDSSARWAPVGNIGVDRLGRLDVDQLEALLERRPSSTPGDGPGVALVHCQWANHEVGTLQPVHQVVELCRRAGVQVHVDACAAVGHVRADLADLGADFVSISSHKMGGPPGVGALIVRRGLRVEPLLVGSAQERGRRAGMENVPGILGFGAAAGALAGDGGARLRDEERAARRHLSRLVEGALTVPGVEIVGDPDPGGGLPHLVCLGVRGVEAEPIVIGLDRRGVAVHSGSACSSETWEPSPVLEAMGVEGNHSLRPSVGWSTRDDDVDAFVEAFRAVVAELRSLRGLPVRPSP